ncbi:MAG: RNA polymerase sigma factor [Candidatus Pacebacteria bacterium]|nr:RNA polymerase sigma factor [Candidatus Paceibacterota bacterium]
MNREEFSEFYDKNIDKVFRFVYLRVDTTETAQDLTSLAFLKLWKRQDSEIFNPTAFLYRIARNQIIDFYREKSKKPLSLDKVGEIADFQVAQPTFSQKIELTLEMESIKKVLHNIKPVYADVIIWHYVDDLSSKEIAQILKKREGNIRVIIHRALKALKEQLEV